MRSIVSPGIRWLGRQVAPLMRLNLLGLLAIVAASVLTLLDPLIIKWLIDEALAKRRVGLLLMGATLAECDVEQCADAAEQHRREHEPAQHAERAALVLQHGLRDRRDRLRDDDR